MLGNQNSGFLKKAYEQGRQQSRGLFVVVFVAIIEIGIHLFTFSHNFPLLTSGTEQEFKIFGAIAAVTGEVFSLGMLFAAWRLAGEQRIVGLISHLVMLGILLTNSVINYSMVKGITVTGWGETYATYGAPTILFVVAALGAYLLIHTDPNAKIRNATLEVENTRLAVELASIRAAQHALLDALGLEENERVVIEASHGLARSAVGSVAQSINPTVHTVPNHPVERVGGNGNAPKEMRAETRPPLRRMD